MMGKFSEALNIRKFILRSALFSIALMMSGCIVVPAINPPPRNFNNSTLEQIESCSWEAQDVVGLLGEPTSIWHENQVYFYHEGLADGASICSSGGCITDYGSSDLLLIRFDNNWRTLKVYREEGPADARLLGAFLREWEALTSGDITFYSCEDNENTGSLGN